MNTVVDLLKKCRVFFLATCWGDQPKVRPFGAAVDIDGKLYLATSNQKDCFKQILANPKVEISGMLGADKWIRITGVLERDENVETKKEFLRQYPLVMYEADDGVFEIFYFKEGTVDITSFRGQTESFNL